MGSAVASRITELREQMSRGSVDRGRTLVELARCHLEVEDDASTWQALSVLPTLDRGFRTWTRAYRVLDTLRGRTADGPFRRVDIWLLGTSTLEQLGQAIELASLAFELDVRVHVAGVDQYETQLLDPSSALHQADPDAVLLAPDARSVLLPPIVPDLDDVLEGQLARWTGAWRGFRLHSDAEVFQLNFVPPYERPLGSYEGTSDHGRRRAFEALNRRLAASARAVGVAMIDASSAAAEFGLSRWHDDRYWFHSKHAVSFAAVPVLAIEVAAVLGARYRGGRKVLVVDLDNTLWGGVVGDDGVEGLELGGSAVGEGHLALQGYLRELRQRGVILAVCSKNEGSIARSPFEQRDDMVLELTDFAAFVASWSDKASGLRRIADELNLGLESFVFVDDNPAERELVRQQLPQVAVIELPSDPAGYRRTLAEFRGFEALAVTAEDEQRTEQYRARSAASQLQARSESVEDFLGSLSMTAEVREFDDATLQRAAQLVNKTNQWNLTTRRHDVETLRGFAEDPDNVTLSLRLRDRFADHGIVAVAVGVADGARLELDTLLMSCRVIGRTVERTLLAELATAAKARGLTQLVGVYEPTERNGLVADLYEHLGFEFVDRARGSTRWVLDLEERAVLRNPFIDVVTEGVRA